MTSKLTCSCSSLWAGVMVQSEVSPRLLMPCMLKLVWLPLGALLVACLSGGKSVIQPSLAWGPRWAGPSRSSAVACTRLITNLPKALFARVWSLVSTKSLVTAVRVVNEWALQVLSCSLHSHPIGKMDDLMEMMGFCAFFRLAFTLPPPNGLSLLPIFTC